MAFVAAMNNPKTTDGVNGSLVYTAEGQGDPRVALYTSLVRDCEMDFIEKNLQESYKLSPADAFVLAFQTRDVRGGKGERELFYKMMKVLEPNLTPALLALIPEYGSWHDVFELMKRGICVQPLRRLTRAQLKKDMQDMNAGRSISLCAKWMPREGSKYNDVARIMANVKAEEKKSTQRYKLMAMRSNVSLLNKYLKTTEINMCNGTWAAIDPAKVPGRNLKIHRKAFLNERLKSLAERFALEDRRACAAHFKEHIAKALKGEVTLKGANVVFPHEITKKIQYTEGDEQSILEEQWRGIRQKTEDAGGLRRTVVLSDVSGSMSGVPMDVSIALGILISEINAETFKDHVMTFHEKPSWVNLSKCKTLQEKVATLCRAPWGGSTNFEGAFKLILQRLVETKVPADEAPQDLLVLTDMGWNQASNGRFHIQNIKGEWAKAGYTPPRIIIWNLRAAFKEYHAKADEEGVVTLSGWSPSILKVLQEGKLDMSNPWKTLRAVLDDERYDPVRTAVDPTNGWGSGATVY